MELINYSLNANFFQNLYSFKRNDALFEKVAEIVIGTQVLLSGKFQRHSEQLTTGWYLDTANPTEKGAMTSPVFVVGYSDIKKVNK